jgi:integrase/recombinase XerC
MLLYKNYLLNTYAKATAVKRFIIARRVLQVAVRLKIIAENPADGIKTHIRPEDSKPHVALSKTEARQLLASVDTSTAKGKRDYAILLTLILTGVRRSELVAITMGDIIAKSGHRVLVVQHGKGNKRREVVLRPEVFHAIRIYLEAVNRLNEPLDAPVFVAFNKGGAIKHKMSDKAVEHLVKQQGALVGLDITPHDLRSTAITFLVNTGSPIIQVQRVVGHQSPTTTERYYTRQQDLDDSPVYKISLQD